ncbi:MAG: rRNA maturation RNase YbeY [Pirellulales bacterium]|nr:rRNA maturation RNase YbeY [Pirellulales bacterium]
MTPQLPFVEQRMNQHHTTQENPRGQEAFDPEQEPPESPFRILVANEQSALAVDGQRLQSAVHSVLESSSYTSGMISIAVVDDPTIQGLNRQFLEHDYPTDVLSFVLEDRCPHLEGELVVSTDTAARNAEQYGWPAADELLLYVIHGCLHLVGYRDTQPAEKANMLAAELAQLRKLAVTLPADPSRWLPQSLETSAEVSS